MKKRLMVMLIVVSMILIAVGCGKNSKKEEGSDKKTGYKTTKEGAVYNDHIKIKKWKDFEIEKVNPQEVTDQVLQSSIESDLYTLMEMVEVKDRGAKEGDQVTISYVGKINGVAFKGGTSTKDDTFILGKGKYIDGFQEGLIGHKQGEVVHVPVRFPDDYGVEELNGKDAVFTITLKKVEEESIPELTDETAKKLNPNVSTVEEYKEQMKENLKKNFQQEADYTMRSKLLTLLFEECEDTKYDEKELKTMTENMKTCYKPQLEYAVYMNTQMPLADYLTATGSTEDELAKMIFGGTYEDLAKHNLQQQYAYELILEVEKLKYTDDDYQKFLEKQGELAGYKASEFEKAYEENCGKGTAKIFFLQTKITDFMLENCTIVEPTSTETTTK